MQQGRLVEKTKSSVLAILSFSW